MDFHTAIGSLGVGLLLLAFGLVQFKKWVTTDYSYLALNIIGSALAAWSSYLIHFVPFVILECVWASVSIYGLYKRLNTI